MRCVFPNLQKDDYAILSVYLFKRQLEILVKDGKAVVAVDIDSPFTVPFIANVLKCKLLFAPFNYEFDGTKYHTLTIVRDSDGENN